MAGHDHTPEIHEHADAWHHHTPEEGLPQHEHAAIVNAGALLKWFIGITVVLVVVILALCMYFFRYSTQMRALYVENQELAKQAMTDIAKAEAQLGTDGKPFAYTALNKQTRTVQIPIEQAMKQTVARYAAQRQNQNR
jgi:flagellar basal body-associated protein FliL